MADTFSDLWRALRLHVPQLPAPLAQRLINDRYRRALERRPWSSLRKEFGIQVSASKETGTIAATRGQAVVVGTGTSFAATDLGRQIQIGGVGIPYTITEVASATSLTLDRVFAAPTNATATYKIIDAYITPPADFMRWLVVMDHVRGWRLHTWVTQDQLAMADPQRTSAGQPWVVADRRRVAAGMSYELWPYPNSDQWYHAYYIARGGDLVDPDDEPIWPLRGDEILKGALADVTRWPGMADQPNPLFGQRGLADSYQAEYEDLLNELERQDEDLASTWYTERSFADWPFAPMDARFWQAHGA